MTSMHIYDPGDGPQLPELPPLPVAILMVGTHDLLAQAADLPQPTGITVQADQRANLEFPPTGPACGPSPGGRCGSAPS